LCFTGHGAPFGPVGGLGAQGGERVISARF
jgi:hypothetical protein